jgi:superfamily II DNA/RNA helicase
MFSFFRVSPARFTRSFHHNVIINFPQTNRPLATINFEALGFSATVISAVQTIFPHIRNPTSSQVKYLSAILRGHDVLLYDRTGTGK